MGRASIVVIGAGASGMLAAISAGRRGREVVVCERMARPGRKLLASGNGRCNLSNEKLDESFYNPQARDLVKSVFKKFGRDQILDFFKEIGVYLRSDAGRIFPATNQSSSVLSAVEQETRRLGIKVWADFTATSISHTGNCFSVTAKSGKKISCDSVVLATGGRTYPALGSDGSGYKLARIFGHLIVKPVPSAVSVIVKDELCHILQGQKIAASVKAVIDGNIVSQADGELLFTKYGLSGTAILDTSTAVSVAINRLGKRSVVLSIDLAPFIQEGELSCEISRRRSAGVPAEDILVGILPNKFGRALKGLSAGTAASMAAGIKDRRFTVTGTRGWNEADFTAGGVAVDEVNAETLESKFRKGLYLCGEILDVNGERGGYNLSWAWSSGFVAGLSL